MKGLWGLITVLFCHSAVAQESPAAYLNCYAKIQKGVSYGPAVYNNQTKTIVFPGENGFLYAYTESKVFITSETFKNNAFYLWNIAGKDVKFVFDRAYDKDKAKKADQKEFRKVNGYGKEEILPPYNFKIEEGNPKDRILTIKKSNEIPWDRESKTLISDELTRRINSIPQYMKDYPPVQKTKDDLVFQLEACAKTGDPQVIKAANEVAAKLGISIASQEPLNVPSAAPAIAR